jgi:antitoxin VapB
LRNDFALQNPVYGNTFPSFQETDMALTIRNPRAKNLAKELAASRHITMTQAVIEALSNELERERQKVPLAERIEALRQTHFNGVMQGRDMTKDEIDAMWGH